MSNSELPARPTPRRFALHGRLASAALAAVALIALDVLARASTVEAHSGEQSYLYLDITDSSVDGRVETPIGDLNDVLGLSLGGSNEEVIAGVDANLPLIHAYLDDHLHLGSGGTTWPISFENAELFASDAPEISDEYVQFFFTAGVGSNDVPRSLDVTFDPFVDEIPGRDALLLIGNDWGGGVIENGTEVLTAFSAESRSQTIDLGDSSAWNTFRSSIQLGVNHIRTGPDHILFVLVLLLPAVLVMSTVWKPSRSFGAALWRVLKIVTMFTIAHSITFTLAGLGVLPTPSQKVVETVIALSIAAAALHNIRPIAANKEWLISFGFGLFHGMGFASLVAELDVSKTTQLMSLLGRNVGIEFGQSVVVLILFPALFVLRRTRFYRPGFLAASVALTVVSLGWGVERAFEVDLKIGRIVDPIVQWPRILVCVALFTAAAAALYSSEKRAGRLLAVHGSDADQAHRIGFDPPVTAPI